MAIAFPGAQGWAAGAEGARNGSGSIDIYWVTNTNNSGTGSFRDACESSGKRLVMFATGGLITLSDAIRIEDPNITILGQTAPGGGITVTRERNDPFCLIKVSSDEIIIRYLRFRGEGHPNNLSKSADCMQIGNDGKGQNIIVDHCSFSGATDETVDNWPGTETLTLQWCLQGPGLQDAGHDKGRDHGFGLLIGGRYGEAKTSVHHNLFVHVRTRTPMISPGSTDTIELYNNLTYNGMWRDGSEWGSLHHKDKRGDGDGWSFTHANVQGCTTKIGRDRLTQDGHMISGNDADKVYLDDNTILEEDGSDVTGDNGYDIVRPGDKWEESSPLSVSHSYPITIESASSAWDSVLNGVGCTIPVRDRLDVLMVSQVRNGTGGWIDDMDEVGGVDTPASGTAWNINSTYNLPQYWLDENGNHSADDIAPSGYTYAEEWANSLSGDVSPPIDPDPEDPEDPGVPPVEPPATVSGIPVVASADDAYTSDGPNPYLTHSSDATIMAVGAFSSDEYNQIAYMRFLDINTANGATVEEAWLKVFLEGINGTIPDVRIYAFDEDDSADLSNETNVRTRLANLTTAYVSWSMPSNQIDEWKTSPDISAILEELFARPGWVPGNNITLVIKPEDTTYSTQERIKLRSWDGDPTLAARLELGDIGSVETPVGEETEGSGSVDQQITDGDNDGYTEGNGEDAFNSTSTRLYAGSLVDAEDYESWIFFTELGIPQNATILTAYIEFEIGSARSSTVNLRFYGDQYGNAVPPTSYYQATLTDRTTAYVDWDMTDVVTGSDKVNSPSLVTILQEMVELDSWSSTSPALFYCRSQDYGQGNFADNRIGFKSFENGSSDAPRLVLTWEGDFFVPVEGTLATKVFDVGMDAGFDSGTN